MLVNDTVRVVDAVFQLWTLSLHFSCTARQKVAHWSLLLISHQRFELILFDIMWGLDFTSFLQHFLMFNDALRVWL